MPAIRLSLIFALTALFTGCDGNLLMSRPQEAPVTRGTTVLVASITIETPTVSIIVGSTYQMVARVSPSSAANPLISWTVTNGTGQATITGSGALTPTAAGTVTVGAAAQDGSGVTAFLQVTIVPPPSFPVTGITVAGAAGATTVVHHSTLAMTATVQPNNASDPSVVWSVTAGTGSATIDTSGVLTATAVGTVTVTATAHDGSGVTGTQTITVQPKLVTGITINTVDVGNSRFTATATISPANASNPAVTWSIVGGATLESTSTNPTAFNGNTTGGTVTVTATAVDGTGVSGSATVTVVPKLAAPTGSSVQVHTGYENGRTVTLSAASGASIYYTTDGSSPTASSTLYTGPFVIKGHFATYTVKAIAVQTAHTNSDGFSMTLPTMYYPIYAGAGTLGTGTATGVWASFDGGVTFWALASLSTGSVGGLSASGSTVYAIVDSVLKRSTDWGTSWSTVGDDGNSPYYSALVMDGSTAYATDDANLRIWKSSTNGFIDITDSTANFGVSDIAVAGNKIYVASQGGGVGEYNTTTSTWTHRQGSDGLGSDSITKMRTSGTVVFFGTDSGVARWDGSSWTRTTLGLLGSSIAGLALDGTRLYATNFQGGVSGLSYADTTNFTAGFTTLGSGIDSGQLAVASGVIYNTLDGYGLNYKAPGASTWTTIGATSHFTTVVVEP